VRSLRLFPSIDMEEDELYTSTTWSKMSRDLEQQKQKYGLRETGLFVPAAARVCGLYIMCMYFDATRAWRGGRGGAPDLRF